MLVQLTDFNQSDWRSAPDLTENKWRHRTINQTYTLDDIISVKRPSISVLVSLRYDNEHYARWSFASEMILRWSHLLSSVLDHQNMVEELFCQVLFSSFWFYFSWTEQARTSESARIPQLKREATNVRKFYSFNLGESRNNLSSKISAVEKSRTSEISRDFSSRQKFSNQLNSSFSYENWFHYHCAGFWRLLTRFKLPWNYESDIKIKL